jgi:hypothetical protein
MLEDLTPPVKELPCAVRKLLERLDESDRNILVKALADEDTWPAKTLTRALADKGLVISDGPIRKHRSNRCSCR